MGNGRDFQDFTDDTDASSTYPVLSAFFVRHRCVRCVYTYAVHVHGSVVVRVTTWYPTILCNLCTLAVGATKLDIRNDLPYGGGVNSPHGRNVNVSARLMSPAPTAVRTTMRGVTAMRTATRVGQQGVGSARTTYLRAKVREDVTVVHQLGNGYIPRWGGNIIYHKRTWLYTKRFLVRRVMNVGGDFIL